MSDGIVKRLRDVDEWYRAREGEGISLYSEAADEIQRLRADLTEAAIVEARLRAHLPLTPR